MYFALVIITLKIAVVKAVLKHPASMFSDGNIIKIVEQQLWIASMCFIEE